MSAPEAMVEQESEASSLGRSFVRGTTWMIALTTLASATNYAASLIFSRVLSTASYGDLTALIALTVIVAVPTGAAQTILADRIARYRVTGNVKAMRYLIRHGVAHVAVFAGVLGLIYAGAIPLVKSLLDLQTIGPALVMAPLLVLCFFMPIAFGILQGLERFIALGVVMLVVALSRIVFGVPWAILGGGAGGALAGFVVGNAVALLVTGWLIRDHLIGRGSGAATTGVRRKPNTRAVAAAGAFIGFAVLSNLDVLLAKGFLPPHESGLYGALATLEKMVIFLPGAVAVVMVPNAAKARMTDGSATRVLRIAALLVAVTTLITVIPAVVAPATLLELMFGDEYAAASSGVLPITLAGSGLAMLYLLVVYTVAMQDRRWFWLLVAGVGLQVPAIALFHDSPTQVATVQAIVVFVTLFVNELVFHPLLRAERWMTRGVPFRSR